MLYSSLDIHIYVSSIFKPLKILHKFHVSHTVRIMMALVESDRPKVNLPAKVSRVQISLVADHHSKRKST